MSSLILWFRQDLRLSENPALKRAIESRLPIIPLYVWDPTESGEGSPGAASRWWLHGSLKSLSADLKQKGSRLIIRSGEAVATIRALAQETGATAVCANRRYEPGPSQVEGRLSRELSKIGVSSDFSNGSLLFEPEMIRNQSGGPFKVFTPFWKHCLGRRSELEEESDRSPAHLMSPRRWPASEELTALKLLPTLPWAGGLQTHWVPGEQGAKAALDHFIETALEDYSTERDRPDHAGTSRLSPYLHFGELSPKQVWHALRILETEGRGHTITVTKAIAPYFRQVGWREFAYHVLFHFPASPQEPLRREFAAFPWHRKKAWLVAWQKGETGYPLVDAGMRELWTTGWMHNRVRMIVASFLVKHLLISWKEGAAWFWDTLVDADLANNTLGWQWVAGCGADAAPYFRIFNPILQGQKFDPEGDYVRKWVPELARLPRAEIHCPWAASASTLSEAGVRLGKNYPKPIVDHNEARHGALEALAQMKQASPSVSKSDHLLSKF